MKRLGCSFDALGNFQVSQNPHWYKLIVTTYSDLSREEINGIFPPLSSLLNIKTAIMHKVLEVSGLCQKRGAISCQYYKPGLSLLLSTRLMLN
jgi:hypothetical protein